MFTIGFDEENLLLSVQFTGEITLKEQINYIESIANIEELPKNLRILQDFRNARFVYQISDNDEIIKKAKTYMSNFKDIKIASIHQHENETAYGILFSQNIESDLMSYKIFSTIEAAKNWLLIK